MDTGPEIRMGWLRAMYVWTVVTAGGFGLGMLVAPGALRTMLGMPAQDPAVFKAYGCIILASGLLAVVALGAPLKYVALLLLQLVYKPIWIAVAAIPIFLEGRFPFYIVLMTGVFLVYIVGDLIAIPFGYLLSKK